MKTKIINSSGFSILMALGVTGVLLIIVTSLAITYIRESQLSRYSYNEVLASTAGEGSFEYGMLKIRNHKDGFQDIVSSTEPDGKIMELSTPRSAGLQSEYTIVAASSGKTFIVGDGEHLVIPLFTSDESPITPGGIHSKNPSYNTGSINSSGLYISGIGSLSWTIIAMDGLKSVALTGDGDINPLKNGIIRVQAVQCYDSSGNLGIHPGDLDALGNCTGIYSEALGGEAITYSYDTTESIASFLSTKQDPYFVIQNSTLSDLSLNFSSTLPFSLPTISITATANKGDSSQVFKFTEDKGKYYDALKYGIYNNP
ncbi:hypothetical protein HOO68_04615 [Candidatus Gracilibacteria bacterium]|nr:hypothetical protein [Candidatus Gracilibacteria bacterium]